MAHSVAQTVGRWDAHDTKFITLVNAAEGIAGWINCVREASLAAAQLNRTLVEPCVSEGHLLSCRYGKVLRVPDGASITDLELANNGADLLAVSRSPEGCGVSPRGFVRDPKIVLPLSAYFDWNDLLANWSKSPMIRYHEWEALRVAPPGSTPMEALAAGKLWVDVADGFRIVSATPILMANGKQHNLRCGQHHLNTSIPWGWYRFPGHTCPARGGLYNEVNITGLAPPFADATDIFLGHWTRTPGNFLEKERSTLPRFNQLHYIAARLWVKNVLRRGSPDTRYAVVQWRSVARDAAALEWCSGRILNISSALQRSDNGTGNALLDRLVLVADLPAPSNPCAVWDHGAKDSFRRELAQRFITAGFAKYDEEHYYLEAGILSIRDMIIAAEANWYVSCSFMSSVSSPMCSKCFWYSSYIAQVVRLRTAAGRPANLDFDNVNASNIVPAFLGNSVKKA